MTDKDETNNIENSTAEARPVGRLVMRFFRILEENMGSMKGKQAKIDAAFGRLADMIQSGHLLAGTDPVGFLDTVAVELKDLRAENVKLKGAVSIEQDRVNDLEGALRDCLRQLEKAINGNAMDGDWIAAELHGRECLFGA